ncbi:MAG TPA: response regulator transcription factor [Kofleriaceae bacterium]|nr:response regulator transcription factor [Kofleriaceae bacterium]
MSAPSVLIVEDDAGTRQALTAALRLAGVEVAQACATGEEALRLVSDVHPDVALVDLGLPDLSGIEVIRGMRAVLPELPVLVLTVFETPQVIVAAIEAGACGYLLKDTPLDEVHQAITQVLGGLAPLSPGVARQLVAAVRRRAEPAEGAPLFALTDREREVLALLVLGHSYASIATALAIQLGTVQTHIKNLYRKLEVSSKAEAVTIAIRHHLVED